MSSPHSPNTAAGPAPPRAFTDDHTHFLPATEGVASQVKQPEPDLPYYSTAAYWSTAAPQYSDAVGSRSALAAGRLIDMAHELLPLNNDSKASGEESQNPSLDKSQTTLHTVVDRNGKVMPKRAIDIAAGTGSLALNLAARFPNLPVLATDIAPGMLEELRKRRAMQKRAGEKVGEEGGQGTSSVGKRAEEVKPDFVGQGKENRKISDDDGNDIAGAVSEDTVTAQILDMKDVLGGNPPLPLESFTHVFSTMSMQLLPDPHVAPDGALYAWLKLLAPGGVLAIAIWNFDERSGLHEVWAKAARAVVPTYEDGRRYPERGWAGLEDAKVGMKTLGLVDVQAEAFDMGFNVGLEGFMRFWWESGNPLTLQRRETFPGDLEAVRREMESILIREYESGWNVPFSAALVVGRKEV